MLLMLLLLLPLLPLSLLLQPTSTDVAQFHAAAAAIVT